MSKKLEIEISDNAYYKLLEIQGVMNRDSRDTNTAIGSCIVMTHNRLFPKEPSTK